ncbi:MAG TPA: hypothetical protein PLO31_04840 [Dysgonamonadaceae bacterium]|nr:hypothetical protein [Dysgonamonadaceae bacterium]
MKKNFYYSLLLWSIIVTPLFAQQYNNSLGVFQSNSDVGNVKLHGKTVYDSEKQIYALEGAGANIWYDQDEFQYAWKKIKGDFILTAQVEFLGEGIDPHRKLGWMVRQSLDASSPHVSAVIHGDGLTSLQYRTTLGENMSEKKLGIQSPDVVQLMRKGNSEGLLYTYDLASGKIEQLNTGSATQINNDHAVTFDGQYIGISSNHDPADKGQSAVYYLPITGGEPVKVTQKTPSYFHGWSPDGKEMAFIGQRNGNFDVYKIPRESGNEIRLTTAEGLDDGSEYTPDGSYIYFNSVRTGTMQIWRMKPDGSDQEQVTHDPLNNWFPHISPDGKWIVFITFGNDVDPSDHPFYKHVYLRMMPISGGKPKVVAYLYGGQGTMNVPSWSPDSRKIAFVSNSGGIE